MANINSGGAGAKTSNFLVGIIDGTGPAADDKDSYGHAMAGGFCKQFEKVFQGRSIYVRGPSNSGAGLAEAVEKIVKAVGVARASDPNVDIVLIGYSRGGLGCLIVAEKLKQLKIDVHSLVLLDPVDRYGASSPYKLVPDNVRASFRAFRNISASIVLKYEGTMPTLTPPGAQTGVIKGRLIDLVNLLAPSNPIRPMFSSTALGVQKGGFYDPHDADQHYKREFLGSHGAMGGVGYEWVAEDSICEAELIKAMREWLGKRIDASIVLTPNFDPDLKSPSATVGGWRQVMTSAGYSAYDLGLIGIQRLDALVYKLREW